MKCVFQVLRREDGVRSPALEAERAEFARVLEEACRDHPEYVQLTDYVIVLMEHMGEPNAAVSLAPILSIERFIAEFLRSSPDA